MVEVEIYIGYPRCVGYPFFYMEYLAGWFTVADGRLLIRRGLFTG